MPQSTTSIAQRYKQLMESNDMPTVLDELYDENVVTIQTYAGWNSNSLQEKRLVLKNYFDVSSDNTFILSNPLILGNYFKVIVTAVGHDTWTNESYKEKFLCIFEVKKGKIKNERFFYENFERFSIK